MASGTQHLDSLLKEYLIFRGFFSTAKQLDLDLRSDKDKGLRPDILGDQLLAHVQHHDRQSLVDCWSFLDKRLFSRLSDFYHSNTKKLYYSLLKYYVVTAAVSNRQDKVTEFFESMTLELQSSNEWKDWFAFPFIKNPESSPLFAKFFAKAWQDALQLSLYNYLSVVIQAMPTATLLELCHTEEDTSSKKSQNRYSGLRASMDLMDDFYFITQSLQIEESNGKPSKPKGLIAKVKSQAAGPAKSKPKPISTTPPQTTPTNGNIPAHIPTQLDIPKSVNTRPRQRSIPTDPQEMRQELLSYKKQPSIDTTTVVFRQSDSSQELQTYKQTWRDSTDSTGLTGLLANYDEQRKTDYFLIGQQSYTEHSNAVTHVKFSPSGHMIASADVDGVVKVWMNSPEKSTKSTLICKTEVICLEWTDKPDIILVGCSPHSIKVYNINSNKTQHDLVLINAHNRARLQAMTITPSKKLVTACLIQNLVATTSEISIWDMNTHYTMERSFNIEHCIYSIVVSLDTIIIGREDGDICLIDSTSGVKRKQWHAHSGVIHSVHLSPDNGICTTMDSDNTISQWSLPGGRLILSDNLHPAAAATFKYDQTPNTKTTHGPLFAFDGKREHFVTCNNNGSLIYYIDADSIKSDLSIGGHRSQVLAVDWLVGGDTEYCLSADSDGLIHLNTLLKEN